MRAGRVVATWKRTLTKSAVRIAVQPLTPLHSSDRAEVERAFEQYAQFVERTLDVRWP
ncbi:crosslink repair DNA glycosylase YcaQ family protein [Nonomuraea sp. NPDC004580]|uniref:DNA glycosylase AlkZ-like family protein n=1 Tax=Nonomuraea sp. NPDC004580 TaxID=3154552 RepID=UPI0033B6944D